MALNKILDGKGRIANGIRDNSVLWKMLEGRCIERESGDRHKFNQECDDLVQKRLPSGRAHF